MSKNKSSAIETAASPTSWLARHAYLPYLLPLLLLPILAYAVGVGVFVLVHWSYRYGQQYYWLGWLSAYLITCVSARADRY